MLVSARRRERLRRVLAGRRDRRGRRRDPRGRRDRATPAQAVGARAGPPTARRSRDAPPRAGRERARDAARSRSTTTWTRARRRAARRDPTDAPRRRCAASTTSAARPGTDELWVAHLMLGTDTPQPALDFDNTVFPALSILDARGQPARAPLGQPRTPAGRRRRVRRRRLGAARARVLRRRQARVRRRHRQRGRARRRRRAAASRRTLVRPLPGHLPEGVVWHGGRALRPGAQHRGRRRVPGRAGPTSGAVSVTQDGTRVHEPARSIRCPPTLRLGQQLFYSANSDECRSRRTTGSRARPATSRAAATRSPGSSSRARATRPSNAGGMLDTGFLFRTADRTKVQDYWHTIDVEQGGHFDAGRPRRSRCSTRSRPTSTTPSRARPAVDRRRPPARGRRARGPARAG